MNMLPIREIFPSIQGEGPYSGRPAIFVRLAGCNLVCDFCDTDHDSDVREMTPEAICTSVLKMRTAEHLVVITGGEPFLHDISELVTLLHTHFHNVQIESNGTIFPEKFPWHLVGISIVCSPKPNSEVDPKFHKRVHAWKYVVNEHSTDPDVPRHPSFHTPYGEVYIQPMDEKDSERNSRNLQRAIKLCTTFGYHLSIQLHKVIGLP